MVFAGEVAGPTGVEVAGVDESAELEYGFGAGQAPAVAGVYGWHFEKAPCPELSAGRLLYVGIAPRYMANRTSTRNLRKRVRYHHRGNAAGSALRLTLGCLLGIELRRVGSGKRMTFGRWVKSCGEPRQQREIRRPPARCADTAPPQVS